MSDQNSFRGKIQTHPLNDPKQKWSVDFDLTPLHTPSVDQTLMCNFKDLKFAAEEKRLLAQKYREEILIYQSLNEAMIAPYRDALIAQLNQPTVKDGHIEASDCGAYICLAAIFSGKLARDKQFIFELSNLPLSLFPKEWIYEKHLAKDMDIRINIQDSWIASFQSLVRCPSYLHLPQKPKKLPKAA